MSNDSKSGPPGSGSTPKTAAVPKTLTGWRSGLLIVAFWTLYGVVTGAGLLFSPLSARPAVPIVMIATIFVSAYTWAALTLPLFRLTRALDLEGGHRPRRIIVLGLLGLAIAAAVSVTLAAVSWLVLLQFDALQLEGTGGLWLIARFRFLTDVLACLLILAAGMALDYFRRYQERQQEASDLRAQLVESRLMFLRSQLNPHFLSNTMNAVSALVSKDPKGVRRMIARLSELLRYTLEAPAEPEVTLEQELGVLKQYLEILEIRYQGRLRTSIEADPALLGALVPNLILQPLAENAMEHGVSQTGGYGEIVIRARREAEELVLSVQDSGAADGTAPSLDEPASDGRPGGGYGLRHARDRLEQLYSDRASLELRPIAGGGMTAEIRLPYRMGPTPAPAVSVGEPVGASHA
jgi:two-component system LytT family sensor kinase